MTAPESTLTLRRLPDGAPLPLGPRTTLGRGDDCDVCLDDPRASREHAAIERSEDGRHTIVDLESTHGTTVNGVRIGRRELNAGDIVGVGDVELLVAPAGDVGELPPEALVDVAERSAEVRHSRALDTGPAPAADTFDDTKMLRAGYEQMRAGLVVQEALDGERTSLPRMLTAGLREARKYFGAERGAILLTDAATGRLMPVAMAQQEDATGRLVISRSIVHNAVDEQQAIVATDTGSDPRFMMASSVQAEGIHSALCAPLVRDERVLGVLYLDSRAETAVFAETDLGGLTAIALRLGAAIAAWRGER